MKLPRTLTASLFEIQTPRWKQRTVGLAKYKISDHNEVVILAKGKDGKPYYPGNFYIAGDKALNSGYEEQTLQPSGLVVIHVPINDLEPLERTDL